MPGSNAFDPSKTCAPNKTWVADRVGSGDGDSERLVLICLPNSAPPFSGFAECWRRVLDSGQVGQGTPLYSPSEPSVSRVPWPRSGPANAEAGSLKAAPIAEPAPLKAAPIAEAGPVSPEEFPYPSTVTGTVPLGAPVTVSWAAAGVVDTTAQTAAVDRNVKTKRFI